jgi:Flp pilus assembly pilin Flp
MHLLRTLWRREEGQDLIEYTLLLAFLALATAGFFGLGHNSIAGIVNTSNSQISYANNLASGS